MQDWEEVTYTEFAEKTPKDTIILTLACGKYRFNKKNFGNIGELLKLLDVGQCKHRDGKQLLTFLCSWTNIKFRIKE